MKNNNTALLISTNNEQVSKLAAILKLHLFEIIITNSGNSALTELKNNDNIDIVLLDILLPDTYGIELCKNIRQRHPKIPLIFVSKVTDSTEIVLCFEAGADDYIEIPYNQHILLARIKAKLRHMIVPAINNKKISIEEINIDEYSSIEFGKWTFQTKKSLITHPVYGEIYLTDKENILIKLLLSNPISTFTREDIAQHLNLSGKNSMIRDVNIHIHRLRNKLTQGNNTNSPIKAVRSQGYTMDSYLTYIYDGNEVSCF